MKQSYSNQSVPLTQIIRLFFILIVISNHSLHASSQALNIYNNQLPAKTAEKAFINPSNNSKKRFWRAAGEWTMIQALPWASNRYVRKAGFARISFHSIHHNMGIKNQEFDDNKFYNNQFSHPYQGSLYFNSFRSNGYNFWESVPAVFAGTFIWETIGETHVPAPNDIINTSLGGIVLGEMSSRLSKIILRKKNNESKGILREPLSFIISPLDGLNRLFDGQGKANEAPVSDDIPASLVVDGGMRLVGKRLKYSRNKTKPETFGRICLQYGDPYSNFKEPFSNFSMTTEFGNSDSAKTNILQIEGCIFGRKIKQTHKSVYIFNITMNYDLYQNSSFVYGAQSFRANLLSRFSLSKNFHLQMKAGAGIIPLAAVPNNYMYYGEGRKYDYCSGISFQAGAAVNIANKLFYNFNCNAAGAITINGYKSSHLFYNTTSELRVVIYKKLTISAASSNYFFNGYYKDYPTSFDHHQFRYLSLGYKMTI